MNRVLAAALLSLLAVPALSQDPPQQQDKLEFKFKAANLDAVLEFISRKTGYIFVNQAQAKDSVDAVSDTPIPKEQVLDFLNTVLKPKGVVALVSPHNPRVVEIVTLEEAKRKNIPVRVGADPTKIEPGDRVMIQIVPLQGLEVKDFDGELKGMIPKTAEVAKDSANNALILTDSADNIRRFLELLSHLEGMKYDPLRFKVIELKNAEANDVARVIQDFSKKDFGGSGKQQGFSWHKAWFPDSPERASKPRSVTTEVIKAIPEPKGNFLIVVATEENLKLIETLISQIDQRTAAIAQVKVYHLRSVGARELSDSITQLFRGEQQAQNLRQPRQLQWWDPKQNAEIVAAYPIKSLADTKSNTLMITASPDQVKLIDRIVESFDLVKSTKMYQLRFAEAKQTADFVLQLFKGQPPEVTAVAEARTNTVVVTASDEQLAVLDKLVSEVDRQIQDSLKIKIFPIKNANADEVAATISQVLKPSQPGGVSIRPVETHVIKSTNSIVVRGPEEYFSIIENVIAHHESSPREEPVTILVKLNNASAKSVAEILKATGGQGTVSGPAMPPLPFKTEAPKDVQKLDGQDEFPQGRRKITGTFDVQADESSNTVIVRTSPRNVDAIKAMISELDRYRPQVLIKVLITEVTLDKELQYGVEAFLENRVKMGGKEGTQRTSTRFGLPTSGFAYLLSQRDFETTLRAFADEGKLKVLATPRVLALDNQAATLSTGKRVPFITSSRQTPEGSVLNTVQYLDIGIILKVTPRITNDGMVTMQVRPEVSDTTTASASVPIAPGVTAPTFTSNYVETTVTVKNSQTVILGGLIREFEDESESKVPLLGDIPGLGLLFSKTIKVKQQRELMIFITPEVVFSAGQLEELTAIEKARLRLIDERKIESEMGRWLKSAR